MPSGVRIHKGRYYVIQEFGYSEQTVKVTGFSPPFVEAETARGKRFIKPANFLRCVDDYAEFKKEVKPTMTIFEKLQKADTEDRFLFFIPFCEFIALGLLFMNWDSAVPKGEEVPAILVTAILGVLLAFIATLAVNWVKVANRIMKDD